LETGVKNRQPVPTTCNWMAGIRGWASRKWGVVSPQMRSELSWLLVAAHGIVKLENRNETAGHRPNTQHRERGAFGRGDSLFIIYFRTARPRCLLTPRSTGSRLIGEMRQGHERHSPQLFFRSQIFGGIASNSSTRQPTTTNLACDKYLHLWHLLLLGRCVSFLPWGK